MTEDGAVVLVTNSLKRSNKNLRFYQAKEEKAIYSCAFTPAGIINQLCFGSPLSTSPK